MTGNPSASRATQPTPNGSSLAPFVAAGVVAVTAMAAAYLSRPSRRRTASRPRQSLASYLRDHLSGSDVAIHVVRRLHATHEGTSGGQLFGRLVEEFEQERAIVESLLAAIGAAAHSPRRAAAYTSGVIVGATANGVPGDLSHFRTLEWLAIGIQGKRCLWRALQALGESPSAGNDTFAELEAIAVRQWEAVEERRRAAVPLTFSGLGAGLDARVGGAHV